jgi:hypothetical protein
MATKNRRARGAGRRLWTAKPSGSLNPRAVSAGPEHFGIVVVDCAKARSKWMLADVYGRVLISPVEVEHTRNAISRLQQAVETHELRDVVVAIERTGAYHRLAQRAFSSSVNLATSYRIRRADACQ